MKIRLISDIHGNDQAPKCVPAELDSRDNAPRAAFEIIDGVFTLWRVEYPQQTVSDEMQAAW